MTRSNELYWRREAEKALLLGLRFDADPILLSDGIISLDTGDAEVLIELRVFEIKKEQE